MHSSVGILVWSHITWCRKGFLRKQDNVIHTESLNFFFKRGIIDLSASFTLHCKDSMQKNDSFHEGTTRHDCPASCPLSTFNIGMLYTAALTYKSSQLVSNNINYICMPLSYYFIQLYSKTFLGVEDCSQISWYKVNLKSKYSTYLWSVSKLELIVAHMRRTFLCVWIWSQQ